MTEDGDKVTIHFEDGTSATGDTVVCCDSIRGIGRKTLLGEEKAALSTAPCTVVNIGRKYTAEQARFIRGSLDPVYKFGGHPDQPTLFLITSVDIADLDKPEDWKIQLFLSTWGATHAATNAERVRIFKEAASKYAEPWRSAAQWVPDDTYIAPDHIRYWANPTIWPNWGGKATLAGDAAHPMMPFRAQGLNNAMQDANKYVEQLLRVVSGEKSLADAISDYGNEALERGAAEIKLSSVWGPTLHDWKTLMNTPMMKQGYGKTKSNEESKEVAASGQELANEVDEKTQAHTTPVQLNGNQTTVLPVPTSAAEAANVKSTEEQEAALAPSERNMGDEPASISVAETKAVEPPAAPAVEESKDAPKESTHAPTNGVNGHAEEGKTPVAAVNGAAKEPATNGTDIQPSSSSANSDEIKKLKAENEALSKRVSELEKKFTAIAQILLSAAPAA
jgi:FAD binding domain